MMNDDTTGLDPVASDLLHTVKGFMDPEEGMRLFMVARQAAHLGPCLEIGSYCGKSALYIGSACRLENSVLYSIDHHRGSEEQQPGEEYFDPALFSSQTWTVDTLPFFRQTLETAGLEDTVIPIVSRSETVARHWKTGLGLVFIDGSHAEESVMLDYTVWAPHILPGGYLVFHDIFPDPAKGGQAPWKVYSHAAVSGQFHTLPATKTLGVLQKAQPPTQLF
jgi:predicted O-methyltransferase YrrM